MKHVLDRCTAFKWYLEEIDTDKALALRDSLRTQDVELIAPDVFPIEMFMH